MSILDSKLLKTQKAIITGTYWTNKAASTGTGVLISNTGNKTLILTITSIITGVVNLYSAGVRQGNADAITEALQWTDDKGNQILLTSGVNLLLTTGTMVLKTDISAFTKFGLGLDIGVGATANVSLSYIMTQDEFTFPLTDSIFTPFINNDKFKIDVNSGYTTAVTLMSLFRNIAVYRNYAKTILYIATNGRKSARTAIPLDSAHFPNLIAGSLILQVVTSPWTRGYDGTVSKRNIDYRIAVITTLGQIYHNFPSRAVGSDGAYVAGDEFLFDESVVWDLPTKRYPSKVVDNAIYVKNPCLPDTCYEMHPPVNTDNGYGNGGFSDSVTKIDQNAVSSTYPRFYIPNRTYAPFGWMGGMEYSEKLTLIGTYAGNTDIVPSRIVLIASDDGGRTWFTKWENSEDNINTTGNGINTLLLPTAYIPDSFVCVSRQPIVPTEAVKEPAVLFTHGAEIVVTNISKAAVAVITTNVAHGLTTGKYILFKDNSANGNLSADYDFLRNDTAAIDNQGNGVFLKVKVLSATTFEIYESMRNHVNNITCRHIHHINRCKDGFSFGCGESYPEGWMFYIPIRNADSWSIFRAYYNFNIIRLNSSINGMQRPIGFILNDDNTILFAADNETTERGNVVMPLGRTETFKRSSTGVFKGNLIDIDDITKFNCILETTQVIYVFKEKLGVIICLGQMGFLALSWDGGKTWIKTELPTYTYGLSRWLGNSYNNEIGFEGFLLTMKQ